MAENKSKIKKILIPIIIVLVLIAIAIIIFVVVKNKKKAPTPPPVTEVVSQKPSVDEVINSDILNQKVSKEYNGNYKFKSIMEVQFDTELTLEEQNSAYKAIANVSDKTSFLYYLRNKKNIEKIDETITLIDGKYTKSIGTTTAESGLYFGNLNKSAIFTKDENGSTIICDSPYSLTYEISQTGYWITNIIPSPNNIIYIREKITYGLLKDKCLYVISAYQMI